jgi:predicted metalloprotease
MRFRKRARLDASQVEDYRGRGGRVPGGMPMALGGGGGLIAVVVVLAVMLLGGGGGGGLAGLDELSGESVGTGAGTGTASGELQRECRTGEDANQRDDCRIVGSINSIQAYWDGAFRGYEPTRTRFFDGSIQTGCGAASSAVGPFYCPNDRYVYIDLGFFDQLESELGARGGPLAEAYILAHEYGHHVQNLTGVLRSADRDTGPQGGQVRVELQADCYAGLWVGHALQTGFVEDLTRQDVADALDAAASVGDDRIQERAQGRVVPESWTHGSAEQRQSWFVRGVEGSGPQSCDTFEGRV